MSAAFKLSIANMPSGNITAQTNYAGGQSPNDLVYIGRSPFGLTDDRKSTLNDLFSFITKNITDGAVRFAGTFSPAISAANEGALYYNDTTDTFQGSRNASAYQNLLFGNGTNQQVGVFSSSDVVNGFATFTYKDTVIRQLLMASSDSANDNFQIDFTSATVPQRATLSSIGLSMILFATSPLTPTPNISLYKGSNGPSFPISTTELGALTFGGASNITTIYAGVRIVGIASESHSLTTQGTGLQISTVPNGSNISVSRVVITGSGAVCLGTQGATNVASNVGTVTDIVLGGLTTYQNDAAVQVGNPNAGTTTKTLIVQANPAQTATLFGTQSSGGGDQFQVRVVPGDTNHFLSLLGTNTAPPVATATQWRIYANASGQLLISEGGGAYRRITGGGTSGNVGGPGSSTDNAIVRWDGTGGNLVQNSAGFIYNPGTDPNAIITSQGNNFAALDLVAAATPTVPTLRVRNNGSTGIFAVDPTDQNATPSSEMVSLSTTSNTASMSAWLNNDSDPTTHAYIAAYAGTLFQAQTYMGANNSAAINTNLLTIPDSGFFYGVGSTGIVIGATDASGGIRLFSGGFQFANERLSIGSSGLIGINKTSSIGAQIHVISGDSARIAAIISSAASPSVAVAQIQNDGSRIWETWGAPWQVQAEASTDPTSSQLTAGNHFATYRKNDKLVIAYNNGGTITYLTIPLDGSTTTWTQSTTAP